MTFTQISYFLEVAGCLSFTEAARHLYITQPTLSRQITAIESELNMQLFIRGQKSLKLTPGGMILKEELAGMMREYARIIEKAERASFGMSGSLRIGVLDGHGISGLFPDAMEFFERNYPNIKLYLQRFSYRRLTELLYQKELDAVITYEFDLTEKAGLEKLPVQVVRPVLALPRRNPLSDKQDLSICDIQKESLVIVKEKECAAGVHLVIDACKKYGGFYPDFYFVDSMEDAILWVEAGVKCALFNTGMNIMDSKAIKTVLLPQLPPMNTVMAWYPQNKNDALSLLIHFFEEHKSKEIPCS